MVDDAHDHDALEARMRDGDPEAMAEFFAMHRDRLWRTVNFRMSRQLHARVDPDDVLQEAYIDAAKRLEHYAKTKDMSPYIWLRLIVLQTLIDQHRFHLGAQKRDAGREVRRHGHYAQDTSASITMQLVGDITSPSQRAVRAEAVKTIGEAMEDMDAIDQEVLALRHFEELTNSEVAEVLGIQQKTASIRYVRALKRLKDIMAYVPGFADPTDHA